jgi:hypothetical protein
VQEIVLDIITQRNEWQSIALTVHTLDCEAFSPRANGVTLIRTKSNHHSTNRQWSHRCLPLPYCTESPRERSTCTRSEYHSRLGGMQSQRIHFGREGSLGLGVFLVRCLACVDTIFRRCWYHGSLGSNEAVGLAIQGHANSDELHPINVILRVKTDAVY